MRDDRDRLSVNIYEGRKKRVDREDKSNRQIMEEALDLYFGDEEGELQEKIEEKDEQIADIEATMEEAMDQLEEVKEERGKLKEQKRKIEEQKQDYTEWLDDLLDWAEEGNARLIGDVIRARDGFSNYRQGAEKVQQDLKDRAREQKRHLREGDFTQSGPGRREPSYTNRLAKTKTVKTPIRTQATTA